MAVVDLKPIVPNFVVQEEGSRKVLVYLDIPELKVKRAFPNFLKRIPTNAEQKTLDFQIQSLKFILNIQTKQKHTKIYTLSVARLPSEIRPERCSLKYQRGGCWMTLIKLEPMSWMNRICDDLNPGLETQENDDNNDPTTSPSASAEEKQLRDTDMPPPFNLVPLAPSLPCRPTATAQT